MNLFEKYFQGTLRPEEHQELAKNRRDPAFEAEFQSYQSAFRAIRHQGERELKVRLQAKEASLPKRHSKNQIRQLARRVLQVAAVVFIALLTILLWNRLKPTNDYLTTYFSPALNTTSPKLRGNPEQTAHTPLKKAFIAYNNQDYQTAIEHFQRIPADSSLQTIAHFYQANALLALESSSDAIALLRPLAVQESSYQYQSQWYLALAYLDNDQIAPAKTLLEQLRTQEGSYRQKATDILSALD